MVDPEERGELICKSSGRRKELDVSWKHFLEEAGRKRVCVSGNRVPIKSDCRHRCGRGKRERGVDGGTSDGEKGVVGEDDDVLTEKGRALTRLRALRARNFSQTDIPTVRGVFLAVRGGGRLEETGDNRCGPCSPREVWCCKFLHTAARIQLLLPVAVYGPTERGMCVGLGVR